jgi:hypothetical protein
MRFPSVSYTTLVMNVYALLYKILAYKGRILTIFVRQYRLLYGRTFLQKNLKTTVAYERANEAYPVLI